MKPQSVKVKLNHKGRMSPKIETDEENIPDENNIKNIKAEIQFKVNIGDELTINPVLKLKVELPNKTICGINAEYIGGLCVINKENVNNYKPHFISEVSRLLNTKTNTKRISHVLKVMALDIEKSCTYTCIGLKRDNYEKSRI